MDDASNATDDARFDRLDDAQRELLRLLASGLMQKQIAGRLNVAPVTIEKRLEKVRALVGMQRSTQAAKAFVEFEARAARYGRSIYGQQHLLPTPTPPPNTASPQAQTVTLREVRQSFEPLAPLTPLWRRIVRVEGGENDLSFKSRLIAIAALSFGSLSIAAGAAIAVVLLMSFLIHIARHGG